MPQTRPVETGRVRFGGSPILYRALAIELDRHQTQARAAAMTAILGPELTEVVAGVDLAIAHRAASAVR